MTKEIRFEVTPADIARVVAALDESAARAKADGRLDDAGTTSVLAERFRALPSA